MVAHSSIEWTHHTFNPWWGCTRISPGCDHCYAEAFAKRVGQRVWGADAPRRLFGDKHWAEPLKWNRAAEKAGERHRVFCASMADVFEGRPEDQAQRLRLWRLIMDTPHLDWLLLTKRPGAVRALLERDLHAVADGTPGNYVAVWLFDWLSLKKAPHNVWLGTTVEDQARADARIPALLATPARVHFLSMEPLLERVDVSPWLVSSDGFVLRDWNTGPVHVDDGGVGVDWIIVGGESGPGARAFDVSWPRDIIRQCRAGGDVAVFVKQLGAHYVDAANGIGGAAAKPDPTIVPRITRLRDAKGGDMAEWPADLRVRELPKGGAR